MAPTHIVDVGGYSTRSRAEAVSVEDEVTRVGPVIKALREQKDGRAAVISVDTFRGAVAGEAILAGRQLDKQRASRAGRIPLFPILCPKQTNGIRRLTRARMLNRPRALARSRTRR
jgi:dihydroneopterin aldolase/2-amino-4-hydroxy-6-hydroxymethyldihydropteridine diphosphokinase/dihydropteroate synthase